MLHLLFVSPNPWGLLPFLEHLLYCKIQFLFIPCLFSSVIMQGLKPSFSCSLNESSSIKDMQWTRKPENFYVVLSNLGKLYHGTVGGPMKDVMDNVDAGNFFPHYAIFEAHLFYGTCVHMHVMSRFIMPTYSGVHCKFTALRSVAAFVFKSSYFTVYMHTHCVLYQICAHARKQ